jgi:hypothetical protein
MGGGTAAEEGSRQSAGGAPKLTRAAAPTERNDGAVAAVVRHPAEAPPISTTPVATMVAPLPAPGSVNQMVVPTPRSDSAHMRPP